MKKHLKKLFLSSRCLQENVHDGVHFWKSCRYCCSHFFKKEFHFSHVSGLLQIFLNKTNEIGCLCLWNVLRKRGFISGTVPDTASRNFFKKELHCSISQDRRIRKCLDKGVHFWKSYWVLPPTLFTEYFLQPFEKRTSL